MDKRNVTIFSGTPAVPAGMRCDSRSLWLAAASIFVLASAAPAAAQNADGTAGDSTSSDAVLNLGPLRVEGGQGYDADIVASPKYTEPLLDTPKSVTVITEDVIKDTGATTLTEALRTVPGVTMGMGEGGNPYGDKPFLRGFNSEGGTTIDGIRDTGSQSRETFALEQIEVVKGPDSSYSGRGSAGGTINLSSKSAKKNDFTRGDVTLGTDATKRVTVDLNRAIDETTAFRINGMWHDADLAGRDAVSVSRWGVAPTVTFGLSTPTRITLDYYHMQSDDIPDYGIPYDLTTGQPADVDMDNFYGLVNRDFRKTQSDIGTARIEHDLGEHLTLRNTTRYSVSKNDYIVTNPDDSNGNVANGMVWRNVKSRNSQTNSFANQLDLSGDFQALAFTNRFATGLEYSHERSYNRSYTVGTGSSVPSGTPRCNVYGLGAPYNCTSLYDPNPNDPWTGTITQSATGTLNKAESHSAYVIDNIEIGPEWIVNLGGRYDHYNSYSSTSGGLTNKQGFFNYQAGLVYKPVAEASLYATYATSSTPSGTDVGEGDDRLSTSNDDLEPERNINYEIGAKWNVNQQLALTAAVFRIEVTNARVTTASGSQETIGEERVNGFEIGISGKITPEWQIFGGYSYLDAILVDDGPVNANEGNQFPNTAKHSVSLWTTYDIDPDISVGGGATYKSKVYGNAANTRSVPSYWRFDAMASYRVNDMVTLQLNAQNIFDERYFDRAYSTHMASVAPGRSVLLSAQLNL